MDSRFSPTDEPGWEDRARAAVKDYGDHPATFGFFVCDEPVRSARDSSHLGIARIDGDPVIVSFLKGDGRRYMMIVNRNPARRGRVVVEMQKGWKALEVYKRDGTTVTPIDALFHVGLEPGDGRLFRFEQGDA